MRSTGSLNAFSAGLLVSVLPIVISGGHAVWAAIDTFLITVNLFAWASFHKELEEEYENLLDQEPEVLGMDRTGGTDSVDEVTTKTS